MKLLTLLLGFFAMAAIMVAGADEQHPQSIPTPTEPPGGKDAQPGSFKRPPGGNDKKPIPNHFPQPHKNGDDDQKHKKNSPPVKQEHSSDKVAVTHNDDKNPPSSNVPYKPAKWWNWQKPKSNKRYSPNRQQKRRPYPIGKVR